MNKNPTLEELNEIIEKNGSWHFADYSVIGGAI